MRRRLLERFNRWLFKGLDGPTFDGDSTVTLLMVGRCRLLMRLRGVAD